MVYAEGWTSHAKPKPSQSGVFRGSPHGRYLISQNWVGFREHSWTGAMYMERNGMLLVLGTRKGVLA